MNEVYRADSGDRGICQNPLLASSFLKNLAPARDPNVCSTEGSMYFSHHTSSYRLVRSQQIRTEPSFVGTGTMPEHQSVGSSILEMTPMFYILSSSSFTAASRGMGTCLGVAREKGMASGLSLIVYGCCFIPRPSQSLG